MDKLKNTVLVLCLGLLFTGCQSDPVEKAMIPYNNGNYTLALEQFTALYKEDNSQTELLFFMGVCQQQLSNVDQAIALYKQVLQKEPDAYNAALNMGNCWYKKQDYKKALAAYQQVRQIKPTYTRIFNPMAHMYFFMGDSLMACTTLDSASKYFADRDIDSGLRTLCRP